MHVRFVTQPFENGFDLRDFLLEVLNDSSIIRLDIVVAWAKRSGLRLVDDAFRAFRARGGIIRMVIGISEGGATKQGIGLAMNLADAAYVFHIPTGRTFHPKVYAAYGPSTAAVLVGSHNLTAGGAVNNLEAGTLCRLDLKDPEDRDYLASVVDDYFEHLLDDSEVCIQLNSSTFSAICDNPAYRVGDEDVSRYPVGSDDSGQSQAGVDSDSLTDDAQILQETVFGRSKYTLRSAHSRRLPLVIKEATGERSTPSQETVATGGTTAGVTSLQAVSKRWFKKLSRADAQRPNAGTNPTGHLTLTQNRLPIDHTKYFRYVFFGDEDWHATSSSREEASVRVEVVVHGASLGMLGLIVDHNPSFEAGQGNRTTTLRWGDEMNEYFRHNNLVDDYATLEKYTDGTYKLTIDNSYSGPFVE
jgi:hypothetical protein